MISEADWVEAVLTARSNLDKLTRLHEFVCGFCAEHGLAEDLAEDCSLALEEVFGNVVRYGYRDSAEHQILVRMAMEDGSVVLTIEDDGIAFNPLEVPPPDFELPIENRPVGGLGMHLVRSLMETLEYAREDGRNLLTMRKPVLQGNSPDVL